jgi:DNA-binding helix-hairpin-helix protein with protein kinase domain
MTPIFTTPSGQVIQLDQVLGEGGEGEIWSVKGRPEAAKVYHPSAREREKERKLKVMVSRPPRDDMLVRYAHHSIAWPTELVNEDGGFAGFLMPRLAKSHKILRSTIRACGAPSALASTGNT